MPVIEQLAVDDAVRALLVANELPVDDLADPAITLFGARDGGELLGVVAIQRCGVTALLRSLAVRGDARSRGLGRQLCDHALAHARDHDVYLLTTSAADYFTRLGFAIVDRESAPAELRATSQFSTLCPSSATLMRR